MFVVKTAPVCLFVYKRSDTLRACIASLLKNKLAPSTDLYIFSDAPATGKDVNDVARVRSYLKDIVGFNSVTTMMAQQNKGLAKSIIEGVSTVVQKSKKVIVIEDDLVVSDNFLDYMNEALNFYEDNTRVFSVSGYSGPIKNVSGTDVYFTKRASSWGWATWEDRWKDIDWSVSDYKDFLDDKKMQKKFNEMGSDLSGMLKKQMEGRINSWAIRWTYHQFKQDTFSVFPIVSKVSNEGFSEGATHTKKTQHSRFSTKLDQSSGKKFLFPHEPVLSPAIIKQFVYPYSISVRILYKLKGFLN